MGLGKDGHMSLKLIGALCVIAACGGCGFMMAAQHLAKIRMLKNLIAALNHMECELQYRCTPLPQLCRQAGEQSQGKVRQILLLLSEELESQISPDAGRCMASVLDKLGDVDHTIYGIFMELGRTLGKFDMSGQLRGLENAHAICSEHLERLMENKDKRLRSYQTLGLCAGAAVAILFV